MTTAAEPAPPGFPSPGVYRKRPMEVEAIRYDGTNADAVAEFMGGKRQARAKPTKIGGPGRGMHDGVEIETLEGRMRASVGDWIIRGTKGEYYPCKPDVFIDVYVPVDT